MPKIKSISGTVRMSGPNLDCASLEKTKYAQKANKFECKVTNNTTNSTHDSENSKSSSESEDSESSEGSEESGLSSGAKAGIGIGVAAGVLAIVAILSIFVYKRRQKKRLQQLEKHGNKPPVEVGGITQVEAPGNKSEMTAELEARAKANQNPVELE